MATGELAQYFTRGFLQRYLLCSFTALSWRYGYPTVDRESMKAVPQVIAAMLLVSFSLVLGCQMISEMTHPESDKDASISKAVKEAFLKDKAVDLTDVNVRTADGSVDLSGEC